MTQRRYDPHFPIVVGLCGKAGTGKTTVAKGFVPSASSSAIFFEGDSEKHLEDARIIVDHLYFAMPLYAMASVKTKTQGELVAERELYGIHEVLFDLFGKSPLYGLPPYNQLVALTHMIHQMGVARDTKPRSFLQEAGTLIRSIDPDTFVNWVARKIVSNSAAAIDMGVPHLTFISDLRMPNEAAFVAEHPNGVLIKYTCDEKVRGARILDRDGVRMTEAQAGHESEKIELINPEHVAGEIDSTSLSIKEQAQFTTKFINETFGAELF